MNYVAICALSLCCVLTSSYSAIRETAGAQLNACTKRFMLNGRSMYSMDAWNHPPGVKNANKAIACYQKLVDQGVNEALFNMAMIYEQGFNLTPAQKNSPVYAQSNRTKALGLYKQCAVKKNGLQSHCQVKLGEMYLRQGRGKQQCAKARAWIQQSAAAGDSWGAEDLAHFKQICPTT